MKRRTVLTAIGAGTVAGIAVPVAASAAEETTPSTPAKAAARIAEIYRQESAEAGGTWQAYITVANTDGTLITAVDEESGKVVDAWSTNKFPVAATVLDRVDKGTADLHTEVEVADPFIVWSGDGVIPFDGAYPSRISLGHAISLLLSISEDTSSRLCSQIVTAAEINAYMQTQGLPNTQVEVIPGSRRWYLGWTSAREMHDLWQKLVRGRLLSAASTEYLVKIMRSPNAFAEGIRSKLGTVERGRVATKAGWMDTGRCEAGVIYDAAGAPVVTYSLYADHPDHQDDYSGNHPLIAARARMGRRFVRAVDRIAGAPGLELEPETYRPSNG
ncbi:serine hydrolase [Phytomonospora sp. NPDC050363]|uniref:serine hydrolase n=1 Tax=Phytomonospora sp. NPDC050363 TaxID=3155642 RepID=UPI0033EDB22C